MIVERHLAVAMTSFNRKEITLRSIEALVLASERTGTRLSIYLTDAGSDGTGQAILLEFPSVDVQQVPGSVFWNQGMAMSMTRALENAKWTYLLWLNDDTIVDEDSLLNCFSVLDGCLDERSAEQIVVGETRSAAGDELTYGALYSSEGHPLRFALRTSQHIGDMPVTFNGNFVLMPRRVVEIVGQIDSRYTHSYGDLDYGLRASKAGIPISVVGQTIGVCPRNPEVGTWLDVTLPFRERFRKVLSPKGRPIRDQIRFSRKYGGTFWPVLAIRPYLGVVVTSAVYRVRRAIATIV